MQSFWNEETIGEARRLYDDNYSASQSAALISKKFDRLVTRNAVIGIWHRQGIMGQGRRTKAPKTVTVRKRDRKLRVIRSNAQGIYFVQSTAQADPTAIAVADVQPRHVSLIELTPADCRYPYGDGPFTFCGCPKERDRPYCLPHALLCEGEAVSVRQRRSAAQQKRWAQVVTFRRDTEAA